MSGHDTAGYVCDARIRPLPNDTEIACERTDLHTQHEGALRDYAYAGSLTRIDWHEGDRRNFHGAWPGRCDIDGCVLPATHPGNHAS